MRSFKYNLTTEEAAQIIQNYTNPTVKAIKTGDDYKVCCPCHKDEKPSLSIKIDGSGKLVVYDYAGCDSNTVLKKLSEILVDYEIPEEAEQLQKQTQQASGELAEMKRKYTNKARIYKVGDWYASKELTGKVEAVYDYKTEKGDLAYQKLRLEGKLGFPYNKTMKKEQTILFQLDKIHQARQAFEAQKKHPTYTPIALEYPSSKTLEEMKQYPQWVFWRKLWDEKKQKWQKMPCDIQGNLLKGWNTLDKQRTFEELNQILLDAQQENPPVNGVGFVFRQDDPFVFIDVDHSLQLGEIPRKLTIPYNAEPLTAKDIKGCFVEISQSGRGYHCIISLKDSELKHKLIRRDGETEKAKEAGFECYPDNKFCACTLYPDEMENFQLVVANTINTTDNVKEPVIFITEGEKDCLTLAKFGYLATTKPDGAIEKYKQWKDEYSESLAGFKCYILTDRDNAGRISGELIASRLYEYGKTAELKLIEFSENEVPEKGDVTDYLENHSIDDLLLKVAQTEPYQSIKGETEPTEDKYSLEKVEIKKFPMDIDGNGSRLIYYSKGNIKILSEAGGKELRVVLYDGTRWIESLAEAKTYVKVVLRKIVEEAKFYRGSPKELTQLRMFAKQSQLLKNATEALYAANSFKGLSLPLSMLDRHPRKWGKDVGKDDQCLLNVLNGTIDLDTGKLLPHNKKDYITQMCPRTYKPYEKGCCDLWEKCLLDCFEGDASLVEWFQIYLGYILRGNPKEKTFGILWGDAGDTGKSTVLETIKSVIGLGDGLSESGYAGTIPFERIEAKDKADEHGKADPYLAKVKKCRLVTVSETEQRKGNRTALNYELVKHWSGNDTLPVRDLFGKSTSFEPMFTLLIALNHKPEIRDTKDSTWERMKLIPFNHKFEGKEKDPDMSTKLLSQADGILSWIAEGAKKYHQLGRLPKHPKVEAAVKEYQREENPIIGWMLDCTENKDLKPIKEAKAKVEDIISSIALWCKGDDITEEIPTPSPTAITKTLLGRGFTKNHPRARWFNGLAIKEEELKKLKALREELKKLKALREEEPSLSDLVLADTKPSNRLELVKSSANGE